MELKEVVGEVTRETILHSQPPPALLLFFLTTVLSHWDFSHGEIWVASPGESHLPQKCTTQPTVHTVLFVCVCFHNPWNSDMDSRIFKVHTGVNACNCTWECADTLRQLAQKVDSRRKIPCSTRELNLCQRSAGLPPYQLNYIPTPSYIPTPRWN